MFEEEDEKNEIGKVSLEPQQSEKGLAELTKSSSTRMRDER